MELMFRNSLRYNTDKKSRIVLMTKRLKEFFLDKFQNIVKVSAAMPPPPPPPNQQPFIWLFAFVWNCKTENLGMIYLHLRLHRTGIFSLLKVCCMLSEMCLGGCYLVSFIE
jgi:hypothetical protein